MVAPTAVVAVIITYNPDLLRLARQIAVLQPQVWKIVVVDNGSAESMEAWGQQLPGADSFLRVVPLDKNRGVAVAQNHGIAWARTQGASHVLLMDHDSLPASDMVSHLSNALQARADAAAVGPWYTDPRRSRVGTPFVRIEGFSMRRLACTGTETILPVDHLIASGCLISMTILDKVGLLREDFFIDFVDVEWCLRARHAGYAVYGVCAARMEHSLGDSPVRFLGREYLSHSPWRLYYHVRNAMLLYREPWVPLNWKCVSAWRLALKIGFMVLVPSARWQHLRHSARGFLHGLQGRTNQQPDR
ncbi:MAG: glycosyltransferase family 2 protein [Burkholderiaceae bacterium]|nr:glycosyltransferase family 2 protein [Burkholderiaceae bacterium]